MRLGEFTRRLDDLSTHLKRMQGRALAEDLTLQDVRDTLDKMEEDVGKVLGPEGGVEWLRRALDRYEEELEDEE